MSQTNFESEFHYLLPSSVTFSLYQCEDSEALDLQEPTKPFIQNIVKG